MHTTGVVSGSRAVERIGKTLKGSGLNLNGCMDLIDGTIYRVVGNPQNDLSGILADKIGGRTILLSVFPFTALMALFLACPYISTFTFGALGMAAAIGLGNGAVFKLVPEYFPQAVGAVTGLVGAAGGLGGFFPPLVLGAIRQSTGSFTWGFVLLAFFSVICLLIARRTDSGGIGKLAHAV